MNFNTTFFYCSRIYPGFHSHFFGHIFCFTFWPYTFFCYFHSLKTLRFLSFILSLMTLIFWKSIDPLFCQLSLIWVRSCLIFSHDSTWPHAFWAKVLRRWYCVLLTCITGLWWECVLFLGTVDLGHLVKVVFVWFLTKNLLSLLLIVR